MILFLNFIQNAAHIQSAVVRIVAVTQNSSKPTAFALFGSFPSSTSI